MPLAAIPFNELAPLLKRYLSRQEEPGTRKLIRRLSLVKRRGYLKKSELIEVCRWKSARAIRRVQANSENRVTGVTRGVFNTRIERRKISLLTSLSGVGLPMASSILTLTDPKNYGVIDIRAWQLLYKMGIVKTNPRGTNFNFNEWYRYLKIIRYFARKFKVKARDIERTLFQIHKRYQKRKLY